MRCLSCGVGEIDIFGEPTHIVETYCKKCREIIGESNTRRSRLVGAEQINLQVTANVEERHQTIEETQRTAAARLGVKVEALEDLGDSIADILIPYDDTEEESED